MFACSSFCIHLRDKCPSYTLPIGTYRCRLIEKLVQVLSLMATSQSITRLQPHWRVQVLLWQQVNLFLEHWISSPVALPVTHGYTSVIRFYFFRNAERWSIGCRVVLSYSYGVKTMSFGLGEMDKTELPNSLRASSVFLAILGSAGGLKMKICIHLLGEEQEQEAEVRSSSTSDASKQILD
ncbi:LOW QUALITY PROTEIN: hypothetical protein HID58_047039, partial [Brassica napus]